MGGLGWGAEMGRIVRLGFDWWDGSVRMMAGMDNRGSLGSLDGCLCKGDDLGKDGKG